MTLGDPFGECPSVPGTQLEVVHVTKGQLTRSSFFVIFKNRTPLLQLDTRGPQGGVCYRCMSSAPRSRPGRPRALFGRLAALVERCGRGAVHDTARAAVIAADTSNWICCRSCGVLRSGVRPARLGKEASSARLLGVLMRWLRRHPGGSMCSWRQLVAQAAARRPTAGPPHAGRPPSGTRSRAPHWSPAFDDIASAAGAPILCTFLDYARRVGGIGPTVVPSGDVAADMAIIRAFYAPSRVAGGRRRCRRAAAEENGANASGPDPGRGPEATVRLTSACSKGGRGLACSPNHRGLQGRGGTPSVRAQGSAA